MIKNMTRSKKETELVIGQVVAKFFEDQIGEKSEGVITQIVEDTIIVRLKGVLPPMERHLARDKDGGGRLIEELKVQLLEKAKPLLEAVVRNLTGVEVVGTFSSFNIETEEHIEIIKLKKDLLKSGRLESLNRQRND